MPPIAARAIEAIAQLPEPAPVPAVTETASNRLLLIGAADVVFGWAERLAGSFEVFALCLHANAEPPASPEIPWDVASDWALTGHLGAFELSYRSANPIDPLTCVRCGDCIRACPEGAIGVNLQVQRSRCRDHRACVAACAANAIAFDAPAREHTRTFDLVLDLQPQPYWSGFQTPVGYAAPGADPLEQALAVIELSRYVGTFEKPRYVRRDVAKCAHQRSGIPGCSRCLEACDTQAIRPVGDHVAVDPHWCQGCGGCVGVCPTGALRFQYPRPEDWSEALLAATAVWDANTPLVLVLYDERCRDPMTLLQRRLGAMPAHWLALPLWRVAILNEELLAYALTLGVAQVVVVHPDADSAVATLTRAQRIVAALAQVLQDEAASERVVLANVEGLAAAWQSAQQSALPVGFAGRGLSPLFPLGQHRFALQRHKSDSLRLIRQAWSARAQEVGVTAPVPLPHGATWGAVLVADGCTLCFSCVGVCPTQALQAGGDRPQLRFSETRCVQCGLCANACPEKVITLEPRWNPAAEANQAVVLREDQPHHCPRCGVLVGPRAAVLKIQQALVAHPLLTGNADLLLLCADCRVKAQFEESSPMRIWEL